MSPPISDSEDSPTDDDNKRTEERKSKPPKESLDNSFLLFEQSLKARKDWLDKENIEKDSPILEITAVLEGEDNQELLEAIEELEPIPDISAATIAHASAKHLISQFGAPKAILQ